MNKRLGFTLIELLVVIGIIGVLLVALVPQVQKAQIRAKEAKVKVSCATIETSLSQYAQSHNGNYPGLATDVMSPFSDHALGDPALYQFGPNATAPAEGTTVTGVIGGFGHLNNSTETVFEQIKTAKDTVLAGNEDIARYFDVLAASDAIAEYPANPFITSANTGQRARMTNIFRFNLDVNAGFDPNNLFWPNELNPPDYDVWLYTLRGESTATGVSLLGDTFDTTRVLFRQTPASLPVNVEAQQFSNFSGFGTGEDHLFSAGDFAYVPVLSASAYPFGDSLATLEDETYKWGTQVTGYMLFGYGHQSHANKEFEDEQREFILVGLPGYGAQGVDTIYEYYVLHLFEGAIYYQKKI
jgi:prepilin-type N-terminal cleavage/methylation domain-containing protein